MDTTDLLKTLGPSDRALFVLAHPDDELLTCGGTLVRCASKGIRIAVAFGNDGRQGRLAISKRFLESLGASVVVCQDGSEALNEPPQRGLVASFENLLNEVHPSVVITHGIYRGDHQEHQNIARLMTIVWQRYLNGQRDAAVEARLYRVCPMPTGSDFVPDTHVDIADSIGQKLEWLAEMHRFGPRWYLDPEIQERFAAAAGKEVNCAFAELFYRDRSVSFFGRMLDERRAA